MDLDRHVHVGSLTFHSVVNFRDVCKMCSVWNAQAPHVVGVSPLLQCERKKAQTIDEKHL
jgi:hypothetical protein